MFFELQGVLGPRGENGNGGVEGEKVCNNASTLGEWGRKARGWGGGWRVGGGWWWLRLEVKTN